MGYPITFHYTLFLHLSINTLLLTVSGRVNQHNDRNYTGSKTTKRFAGPWNLVWTEQHNIRSEAVVRERHIKKRGITRFLKLVESRQRRD